MVKDSLANQYAGSLTKDFYCHRCSCKVTERANTDGRAAELADVALYLCDACAKKEQKKVDIEKISEYRILQKVGGGGMSAIYEAWHTSTYRLVALKKIFSTVAAREGAEGFFQREAHIIQNLIHPHIVRLIDYRIGGNQFYFVFEYLPGGDLYTFTRRKVVSITELCTIFCQVLDALHYMHMKGFVHRDIKPHNILLTQDRRGKLSDFTLTMNVNEVDMTQSDLGRTLLFMAPEEIVNHNYVSPQADVYSAGVSFYNALTNKFPFSSPKPEEIIRAFSKKKKSKDLVETILEYKGDLESEFRTAFENSILREDRIPVQYYRRDISPGLATIIDKSVMRNKEDRFKSAQEMRDVLLAYLNHKTL